jgi:hypothetical protein
VKSFIEFCEQEDALAVAVARIELFEHETYKLIPKTNNSYRIDPSNVSAKSLRHAHVYAKPKGLGQQLYVANVDGTGKDGFSGTPIPARHADFFRSMGFEIKSDNILERMQLTSLDLNDYSLVILDDEPVLLNE